MNKLTQKAYIFILTILIVLPLVFYAIVGRYLDTKNWENRTLADFPKLTTENIREYPGQFEAYFNDRLPFKYQLIFLNSWINYYVFHTTNSKSVIVGKDGWLFYKGSQVMDEDPVGDYRGTNLFTDEELAQIAANMQHTKDFLAERGCEFAILIAPNKERMYDEYMPDEYGDPAQYNRIVQVTEYLREHTDVTVVSPYETLLAYKQEHPEDLLYYTYDTHWNNVGSYLGARELATALGWELPELDKVTKTLSTPPVGDLSGLLGMGDYLKGEQIYTLSDYSPHTLDRQVSSDLSEFVYTNTAGDGADEKLFIIGDSFSTMMSPYIASHYNNTYLNFYFNYTGEMLEREDPDVVVFETVERYLDRMLDFDIDAEYSINELKQMEKDG
ncbi:MAG: hypothetical protein IJR58_08210 [Lachnospiraceae bacterium]|nr:hypothetical protein [Lachnospiraceae bacterium]